MEPGDLVAGKYKLERPLASGGMGTVWIAEQQPLLRRVALKTVRQVKAGSEVRFLREMQALAKISDMNVVTIYDSGRADDGSLYLAMELIDGPTLREELRARGRMPLDQSLEVVRQVASGLAAAHGQKIAHLDLKPENIVLHRSSHGREAKICDFGIARMLVEDVNVTATADALTEEGAAIGTPGYMSPEQLRGVRDDVRSDLYALGVIWFELLTGRAPFAGKTTAELAVQHLTQAPPRVADVAPIDLPPAIEQLIARLLAKEPADRPADAGALVALLRTVTVSSTADTATATRVTPSGPTLRRPVAPPARPRAARALALVAVVVVAGAGAAAMIARRGGDSAGPKRVAVLSLIDAGGDATFGAMVSDAIASSIGDMDGAQVVSALLVARAERQAHGDRVDAAEALNADYAVTGSVRHEKDGVVVDVNLNDVRRGTAAGHASSTGDLNAAVHAVVPPLRALLQPHLARAPASRHGAATQEAMLAPEPRPTPTPPKDNGTIERSPGDEGTLGGEGGGRKRPSSDPDRPPDRPPPSRPAAMGGKAAAAADDGVHMASTNNEAYRHYLNAFAAVETDVPTAEREFLECVRLDPSASSAWVHLAILRLGQGGPHDPGVAEMLAHATGPLAPRERGAREVLDVFVNGGDAVAAAKKFIERAKDEPIAWLLLATALASADVQGALRATKQAVTLDPDMAFSSLKLIEFQMATQDLAGARRTASAYLRAHPDNAGLKAKLAAIDAAR